jgi:hypothetical protein
MPPLASSRQRSQLLADLAFQRAITVCAAVLGFSLAGCLTSDECHKGEWRCNGDVLESCTVHGGGVYGSGDDVHYTHSSDNTWDGAASCGDNRCVSPEGAARPFCALDAVPVDACASGAAYACDGDSSVRCKEGFAIERRLCNACDAASGECTGDVGSICEADDECAAGLFCDHSHVWPLCARACECADGEPCAVCDPLLERTPDPSQGKAFTWVCRRGTCFESY